MKEGDEMALIRPIPYDAGNIKYVFLGLGNATNGNVTIPKGRYKILAFNSDNLQGYASGTYYFDIKIGATASNRVIGVSGSNLTIVSQGSNITNSSGLNDFNSVAPVIEVSEDSAVNFSTTATMLYHNIMIILIPDK